jgi:hypothetical protein
MVQHTVRHAVRVCTFEHREQTASQITLPTAVRQHEISVLAGMSMDGGLCHPFFFLNCCNFPQFFL